MIPRTSFDPATTPRSAYLDLITPMCGEGAAQRLAMAFEMIEKATTIIDDNDIGFAFPVPGMLMKHYTREAPPPDWWSQVRDLYNEASIEAWRTHDGSYSYTPSRNYLRSLAKRLEFAAGYLSCVEAISKAGQAKRMPGALSTTVTCWPNCRPSPLRRAV